MKKNYVEVNVQENNWHSPFTPYMYLSIKHRKFVVQLRVIFSSSFKIREY